MRLPLFLLLGLALVSAGCAGDQESRGNGDGGSGDEPGAGELSTNITVVNQSETKETAEPRDNATGSG